MLLKFRLENFRSFKNAMEFTALATREAQHSERVFHCDKLNLSVLPTAAFFGGNGSGKSNLFLGMKCAADLLLRNTIQPEAKLDFTPFRLDTTCFNHPTSFSFEILIGQRIFEYSFSFVAERILSEKLLVKDYGKRSKVFSRLWSEGSYLWNLTYFKSHRLEPGFVTFKSRDTLQNKLFLGEMRGKGISILDEVADWFRKSLVFLDPHSVFAPTEIGISKIKRFREYSNANLKRAGTGIEKLEGEAIDIGRIPMDEAARERLGKNIDALAEEEAFSFTSGGKSYCIYKEGGKSCALQLISFHKDKDGKSVRFELVDESEGTKRFIEFLPVFFALCMPQFDGVFFVDEIDRSLHTHLTRNLIEAFFRSKSVDSRSQLFFTTHDQILLDQQLFRRDEIWLLDRDDAGSSRLASLGDFKGVRKDKDIRKSYSLGRYGGVPELEPFI